MRVTINRSSPEAARTRVSALVGPVVDLVALTVATVLVGRYSHAFTGFPKGYDAWGHLSKARMVLDKFPDINWNDQWYAGQPAFLGSYPPGYHLLLVAISWVTGWSLSHAMVMLGAGAVIALIVGCYLLVFGTTGSRAAALLASGLLLASATLWDQVIELGLYPRFTGLSFGALAAGCAALHRRHPTRLRATATVVLLAASLGTHPVSGGICAGVVGLVLLCAAEPSLVMRAGRAVLTVGAAGALCGFFYVPLVLMPRAQSATTDFEIPLRWSELGWPTRDDLSALPPLMLIGTVAVAVAVGRTLLEPRILARRAAGIPIVTVSPTDHGGDLASAAALDLVATWDERRKRDVPDVLVALGLTGAALIAIGYGLVGHFTDHFAYYVNGLQPRDLLVYTAWLLSAALGTGAHIAVRHRRVIIRAMTVATSTVLVAACIAQVVPLLPGGARDTSAPSDKAIMDLLPPEAHDSQDYRIFGPTDGTSRWINAVTDTAQLRGYDDHGDLHLDWQYWLETVLVGAPEATTPQQRRFLLDYYAARWLYTDSIQSHMNIGVDPVFTFRGREQVYADVRAWEYRDAHPIVTAVTAPTVLFIGDDAHYDVLLRALADADVGADRLLPVHGPATLSDVTAAQLSAYPTVVVYGAALGTHPASAAFAAYVRAGGHVVVDNADGPDADAVARAVGSPVVGTRISSVTDSWRFTGADAAMTSNWSPPVWNETLPWNARTPDHAVSGDVLLASAGTPLLVRAGIGAGTVTWSGLNLPYHTAVYGNIDEANYLGRLLGAADAAEPVTPVAQVHPDPQHREVTLPAGVNEVLVREYTFSDWHVTVDGRPLPLLSAGPDMMFVQVPDHDAAVTVRFEYRLDPREQLGNVVSLLAALVMIGYAAGGGRLLLRVLRRRASRRSPRPVPGS